MIDIPFFYSQFDSDTMWSDSVKKTSGTCVETCLKMVYSYLTGKTDRTIYDIVVHGDNNPSFTSVNGAQQSANWLGISLTYRNFIPSQIKNFIKNGHLIIAIVSYNLIPVKYRQISFSGSHAILITGITDDNAVRYADPAFSGNRRNDGWMNNGKYILWNDISLAWGDYRYEGFLINNIKEDNMSALEDLQKAGNMAKQAARDIGYNTDSMPDTQAVQFICDRSRELKSKIKELEINQKYVPVGKLYVRS